MEDKVKMTYGLICRILSDLQLDYTELTDDSVADIMGLSFEAVIGEISYSVTVTMTNDAVVMNIPLFKSSKEAVGNILSAIAIHNNLSFDGGYFVYDLFEDIISYRYIVCYKGISFSKSIFKLMLAVSVKSASEYTISFLNIIYGKISIQDFAEQENNKYN